MHISPLKVLLAVVPLFSLVRATSDSFSPRDYIDELSTRGYDDGSDLQLRDVLSDISTRELVDELSDRLERRTKGAAPAAKPKGKAVRGKPATTKGPIKKGVGRNNFIAYVCNLCGLRSFNPPLNGFINTAHLDTVLSLHWLRVLVQYIPELNHLKSQVTALFAARATKLKIPEGATPVYPLSSSGKSETVTTELKDAMHDFLEQMGQSKDSYLRRLFLVGGDGLTFQRLLELQRYAQFHPDPLEALAFVEPVLAMWHTEWTDVSRVFEVHFDSLMSPDPSSLGHSAALIGRPAPASLKKVDYYPAVDLMYLVLEVRILDCWRLHFNAKDIFAHFTKLATTGSIPSLKTLEETAQKLHSAYSTTRAIYRATGDTTKASAWADTVPLGSEWVKKTQNATSLPSGTSKASQPAPDTHGRHEKGDRVLANSITFMRDALLSREISYAIADGDAGRVYEVMKALLFSFAGSSHTKYCTYLLEVVTRLELESSPALFEGILKTTLVNLSGLPGNCLAADVMQEYFNRLLEAIVEKKGIDYGDPFARNVISPNLGHFAKIKLNLRSGVGLAPRSGKHTAPHNNPEIRKLVSAYKKHELHSRRPGRVYADQDKDDFTRGMVKLESGRLQKFVFDTTHQRGLLTENQAAASLRLASVNSDLTEIEEDVDEPEAASIGTGMQTLGMAEMIDGGLVIGTFTADDVCAAFDEYMAEVDEEI
ncbi:hypothetical protein DFP72DRAFT_1078109 [Ephemerocybe angulata]|uniref:DUF6589 domain-containing protein n=1 Tax=Ephemerocybe angulata TaxID=980116 RepID=A0A8H6HDA3_9AGAR|nr:hypothetical protein DFP72DRAFT_1078109 [Tulosesus angulatus]